MNQAININEAEVMDQAMAAYLLDAVIAKSKNNKIKINMECRRKLEIQREERRLRRAISEFDFDY